jgi:hypothetical protein
VRPVTSLQATDRVGADRAIGALVVSRTRAFRATAADASRSVRGPSAGPRLAPRYVLTSPGNRPVWCTTNSAMSSSAT